MCFTEAEQKLRWKLEHSRSSTFVVRWWRKGNKTGWCWQGHMFVTFLIEKYKALSQSATVRCYYCFQCSGALGCTPEGKISHIHKAARIREKRYVKSLSPYVGKTPACLSSIAAQMIVPCRDLNLNKVWKYTPEQDSYTVIQFLISEQKFR